MQTYHQEEIMRQVSYLIKPASSLCNLRCRYCFYEDEANNRNQKSMGVMTEQTTKLLIADAFSKVSRKGEVLFTFQGGEPTVAGIEYFRSFAEEARRSCPEGVRIRFSIQTNGILINQEWADFFFRERFLVGISLDGEKDLHDGNRIDPMEKGTWSKVEKNAKMLLEKGVAVNALCVVTKACARRPKTVYESLKKIGFRYLQFIACLDPIGEKRGSMPWSLTPEAYGKFLCNLFDLWYADWEKGDYHSIRLFDDYIHLLLQDGASTCATCGSCGEYTVVEGDGSLYPCDFFCFDQWRIGKLGEPDDKQEESRQRFLTFGSVKPEECLTCRYRPICNGGCKNDWYRDEQNAFHNYFCSSFKALFEYALPRMMTIARAESVQRKR